MKNKLLLNTFIILLSACFSLLAFAVPAMQEVENAENAAQEFAQEETATLSAHTEGYFTYTVFVGKATIKDCKNSISGEVTIPSTLGDYPVTSIGSSAFEDCTSLKHITIPDSVTSIGSSAFDSCTSLESVTFGKNSKLTSIGIYAFDSCTLLTSIEIPDSVTRIGYNAFWGCSKLNDITILNKDTMFGESFAPSKVTLHGYPESTTATYAKKNNINFCAIIDNDFNNSGAIDTEDIEFLAKDILKDVSQLTEKQKAEANLYTKDDGENGEPVINIKDLIKLAQLMSGK